MKFCAVDIEADQPSNNIIQIGAIVYQIRKQNIEIIDQFNQFLDWGFEPNWSQKLKYGQTTLGELLSCIKDTYDKEKRPCQDVFVDFWDWAENKNKVKLYTQWGSGDLKSISEQSNYKKHIRVIDLKNSYMSVFAPLMGAKKSGLFNTCKKFDLEFTGDHHNAYYDALNTALIHLEMTRRITIRDKSE